MFPQRFIKYYVVLYYMVLVTVDLSKESDRKIKIYMANNELLDKRIAINQVLEKELVI